MLNDQVFFSVIIPAYQCESTLAASLESVLAQKEAEYEIVLVDDGSTDQSGSICDAYQTKYPKQISVLHKNNEGPLRARLDGIGIAKGNYILFLDSDDQFASGALQCIAEAIKSTNADMVIFNHVRVYPDGRKEAMPFPFKNQELFEGERIFLLRKRMVLGDDLNALWQKCIRKDVLKGVERFYTYGNMVLGEDKLLVLDFIDHAQRIVVLSELLYEYRISETSLSHKVSEKHYRNLSFLHCQILEYLDKWKLFDCIDKCHQNRIVSGFTCINYVAIDVMKHRKRFSDFRKMVECVREDTFFWKSFEICKNKLTRKKRILCYMLKNNMTYSTYICIFFTLVLKRFRQR